MIDEKRPLLEHLAELRKRIIICLLAVVLGMIASYLLYDVVILDIIRSPIDVLSGKEDNPFALPSPFLKLFESLKIKLENPDLTLHYIGPLEAFAVKIKLSLFCGIVFALPLLLYQAWRFISIGLREKERKIARIFLPISFFLFLAGLLFSYFIMVPVGLYFLINVSGALVPMLTISKYASLVLILIIVFGVIFELPLAILFITKVGLVTPQALAKKRKYAIFAMFILAALITPPDVFTQLMLAIPVIILYEVSIWISKLSWRKSRRKHEEKD